MLSVVPREQGGVMRAVGLAVGLVVVAVGWIVGAGGLTGAHASQSGWRSFAPLLSSNSEFAVAQLGNQIYVVGGYPSTRVYEATVQV